MAFTVDRCDRGIQRGSLRREPDRTRSLAVQAGMRRILVVCAMLSAAAAEPRQQARNNDLEYIPIDVELVAGMDLPRLRTSAVWTKYVEPALGGFDKRLAKIREVCGVDLATAASTITFGM